MQTIEVDSLPSIYAIAEDGVGVSVFQRGTGKPYLSLRDTDDDGVFDYLEYNVLDADGNLLRTVEDYGFDGQADLILDYVERSGRVFLDGVWLAIDGVDTGRVATVDVDGETRSLEAVIKELQLDAFKQSSMDSPVNDY